ncbi:MAG: anti-sigma factor antagonist [Snowella sp.]|nr:anti-sigma factor antagonist [Snowella sp.]
MQIQIQAIGNVQVIEIIGDIDASTAPKMTETLLPLVGQDSRLLLDMTKVPYMSSAGLRTLLSLARQAKNKNGQAVLVGLSEELTDTMSVTGFLSLFITKPTKAEGLAVLAKK